MLSLKNFPQQEMDIIIEKDNKEKIKLNELIIFPDKMDGLHIWEAEGKNVLELGTGVGIAGITAMKYGKCKSVTISDYKEDILKNAMENVKKNKLFKKDFSIGMLFDWKDYEKMEKKYDIIIGSDVIYAGAPVKELALLLDKALDIGGEAYILIPEQRFFAVEFFKALETVGKFETTKISLDNEKYLISPLENEKEGFKHFAGLKELNFFVYKFLKVSE